MAETDAEKKTRGPRKPRDCSHAPWEVEHAFCPNCGRTPTLQEQILLTLAQHPPVKDADSGVAEESHTALHQKLKIIAGRAKTRTRKKAAAT